MSVVKSLDDGAPKTPKRTKKAAPKKVAEKVGHRAISEKSVEETIADVKNIAAPITPSTPIEQPPFPGQPPYIPPLNPAIEPAPTTQKESEVEIIEEKALGIWGKIKAWKYFWFVVIGLALLIIGYLFLSNYIKNRQNQKSEEKIEAKKEELHQIEVGGDTTLLQQNQIMARKLLRADSIIDAGFHALTDLKRALEYEKKLMPARLLSIDEETKRTRENINNPANTDDDVRRNAESQMSRQQTIPKR